jgi:hypothetical protein
MPRIKIGIATKYPVTNFEFSSDQFGNPTVSWEEGGGKFAKRYVKSCGGWGNVIPHTSLFKEDLTEEEFPPN